jgi:site-specific recombinase XerD
MKEVPMRNWDRLVDEYLEEYTARGISAETVKSVRRELDRLGCWLKQRRPKPALEEVGSDLLISYVRGRSAYRAKATVGGIMSIMRGLGEFLVRQKVWSSNPLRWMKGPKLRADSRIPRRINASGLKKLWEQAATGRRGYHRYLWIASLSLLYGTGLRRGELQRLNVSDWCSEDGTLKIDGRKTGRERQVAVPELTRRCLESYLPQRQNHLESMKMTAEPALLVNKDGGRLSGYSISRAVQALARRAEVGTLTLHQFRHSCASDLLESGVKLPQVQQMLGHQTISTTVRYLHIADPARHAAVARHPINDILSPKVAVGGAA